jgi:hypothetical protein
MWQPGPSHALRDTRKQVLCRPIRVSKSRLKTRDYHISWVFAESHQIRNHFFVVLLRLNHTRTWSGHSDFFVIFDFLLFGDNRIEPFQNAD